MERRSDYLPFGRPNYADEEIEAVARVLKSGWVGMGSEVLAFEHELADYTGADQLVSVSSCTAALHLTLAAMEIGHGDEVVCPSLTWCSTANAALYVGADVRFADINPDTLCVDSESVAKALSPRTKAVVVVHFGGLAIDVDALARSLPAGISLVEDAAHALGARYPQGHPVGSSGFAACFSFYANKNLSTAEGGAIALADQAMADRLRSLRQHGQAANAWQRYIDPEMVMLTPSTDLGFKANYTDLQAAIGRVQLRRFDQLQSLRQQTIDRYAVRLSKMPVPLSWQRDSFAPSHAHHLLVVRLPTERLRVSRDEVLRELRRRNIGATIHYTPLHQMPFYRERIPETHLPVTERIGEQILTLPISASMTPEDADYVCDHLHELLEGVAQ